MSRKIKRILLIFAILVGALLIAAAMSAMRKEPPKKPREELAMLVDVMVLDVMDSSFFVRSQGTVRPRTETVLSAEVSGTITSISPKYIAGGVFEVGLPTLVSASFLGRAGRFLLVGGLIRVFGPQIRDAIDKYFNILSIAFIILLVGGFFVVKLISGG